MSLARRALLAGATLLAARGTLREVRRRKTAGHLRQFTPLAELASYAEAQPRLYAGAARVPHGVLLLHGYSASPYELGVLTDELERAGIPYYAPLLTGHGLDNLRLLAAIEPADWLRDAITAYDLLAGLAGDISVVGHSTGASLAVYVAQRRRVRRLILSGPNLVPAPHDRRYKTLLIMPILGAALLWLLPLVAKPVRPGRVTWTDVRDPEAARRGFSYATLPTRSLRAQWALQEIIDVTRAGFETLTLLYGEQDLTVDIEALARLLDGHGIPYTRLAFADSGHNVLQDYDKLAAARAVVDILAR